MTLQMLLSLVLIVAGLFTQVDASHHHRVHHAQHHAVHRAMARRGDVISNTTSTSNSSAEALDAEAQARIAIANKLRIDNPRFNKNSFPPDHFQANQTKAPPIILTRGLWRRDNASVPIDYSIPPELLQAAKEIAESTSHTSAVSKYAEEAAALKTQYWLETNDTNTPAPAKEPMNDVTKRDSAFWMASMNMNGIAPYAGGTYNVFRNVKDYGAVGDGIHDDTAAINNAVTDGGRCGMSCGSSTAKPAVIYFPGGTYLVSASIVQYYNTQFLGNPSNRPVILAASSFVGLGVVSSDVYIDGGDGAEWYVPQNNFLRSVRNFVIDITNTPADAYVCGIHWQVAQGTDLQNVDFYMAPGTTQQGIYMENGSGGFLSDLYFYGGNIGAYLGNQQFTSRNLLFHNCLTGLEIHWDWAWTMQGITIVGRGTSSGNPSTGISIVGGAGGPGGTGQGVGSFILLDSTLSQLTLGISTTLLAENSTSLLLQNMALSNVAIAVQDSARGAVMLAGGSSVSIPSWGFGKIVTGESGTSSFQNGNAIPAANRSSSLTTAGGGSNFFGRSAPTYKDVPIGSFINVKSYGAKGDGVTDDTSIINQVLAVAANASQIIFFPYGMYVVTETIRVPLGSRVVGQAWPQIVGSGANFQDMLRPRPVVQVGLAGDSGIIEITDMMVSVRGPTAGAVLMEWNVHEKTQGSAAIWNTHLRVGGNVGSSLQAADCPKLTGSVNPRCIAASLLLHLTPSSSVYMENLWAWVADHDVDVAAQTQIDIYSGRGILIESQGPSWLWGTASEHSVMYQYQVSNARDIFFSMIQTESPYFQPGPKAPTPFTPGMFPNDPDFTSCSAGSTTCAFAWALRILDSSSVYIYSSGLYSWYSSYSQACVTTETCQDRGVGIENTSGVWVYALATKAIKEMVSPVKVAATLAAPNQNGYLSSILAWLEGSTAVVGNRFPGWSIFPNGSLADAGLTNACEAAMYQTLKCDTSAQAFLSDGYQGNVGNTTRLALMCDPSCSDSLRYLHNSIVSACASTPNLLTGWPLLGFADMVWSHWNETCFKDPSTGQLCDTVLSGFSAVADISLMPRNEMCSYCNLQKYKLMQSSAFSVYDNATFETRYQYIASTCSAGVSNFNPTPYGFQSDVDVSENICTSGQFYTAQAGDTCDSISGAKRVSSATLFWTNPSIRDCSSISPGTRLCLPLACPVIHVITAAESCLNITTNAGILTSDLSSYNPGINWDCDHLHNGTIKWGSTLCVSPPGGGYTANSTSNGTASPWSGGNGYRDPAVAPPAGSVVAPGTTTKCGAWYKHTVATESCAEICITGGVVYSLFLSVNPSLHDATCNTDLVVGTTYCINPTRDWNATGSLPTLTPSSTVSSSTGSTTRSTNTSKSVTTGSSTTETSTSNKKTSSTSSTVSSTTKISSTSSTSPTPSPTSYCTHGTGPGGYLGLCDFSCYFGFCPSPCTCTATSSTPNQAPALTSDHGYALQGEASDFGPLCDYTCSHNYCPDTVCTNVPPSSDPGSGNVCVQGSGDGGYSGLCSFSCNFGYCPPGPCVCTMYGTQIPPPPASGGSGVPAPGLDQSYSGLCSFACGHGYCPSTVCTPA